MVEVVVWFRVPSIGNVISTTLICCVIEGW